MRTAGRAAGGWRSAAAILLVALALRAWDFGNPVLDLDEQWYLLVGDHVLKGAVPFVDIWDRKPAGLFLLYAVFNLFPGDGVVAYQLTAAFAAAGTAAIVAQVGRMLGARPLAAFAAALCYLLGLAVLGGQGGQAPVFYNLLIAAAVLVTLRLPMLVRDRPAGLLANGLVACGLAGLSIQLKYSTVPECAFVGIVHCVALWRTGAGPHRLAAHAAAWMTAGLAPTLIVIGWYAALGRDAFDAFWFANFVSIGLRHAYPFREVALRLAGILLQMAPLVVPAVLTAYRWSRQGRSGQGDRPPSASIVMGWTLAAAIGFVAIGTFHDHYALPLLVPLACMAAPAFDRSLRLAVLSVFAALPIHGVERWNMTDDGPGIRALAATVERTSHGECPYVAMGDPIVYHLAHACLPTPYAFPNTLGQSIEQGSTGVDEAGEVARILGHRPPVVIMSDRRRTKWNAASLAVIRDVLARDYRLVDRVPHDNWHNLVYVRQVAPDRPCRRPSRVGRGHVVDGC